MRHTALRSVRALRTTAPRRLASSSSSPAGDNAAAAAQKKAQDALGAASAAAARAGEFARSALGPLGAPYQQPVRYNLSVAREVLKHVYTRSGCSRPRRSARCLGRMGRCGGRARSVAYWRQVVASGEWARLGVYAVEAYGIFKIGEIVGRRSLVGYNVQ
ncbi:hypothetical protein EDB83DRAFT_2451548 [Lactarius deliciosus]|nr:hypothetical protein EDB83DRAFT_2451548 [Lactarius deliciosus]